MPARLIKIMTGASGLMLRLDDTGATTARPYAALSYCWGGDQDAKTTTDLYPQYVRRINVCDLPKSVQDAISVTVELGLNYLWVDSLCIIQDDCNDMEMELMRMPDIYSQATVTISASRANSAYDGFLQRRIPPAGSFTLPYRNPSGGVGSVTLISEGIHPLEPLDKRAWVLQERLLSPRVLDFGTLQTRWTCTGTPSSGETAYKWNDGGPPNPAVGLADKLFQETLQDVRRETLSPTTQTADCGDYLEQWRQVLHVYSKRCLTLSTDRLPAIAGIAERMARGMGDRYLAGLWESALPHELLWKRLHIGSLNRRPLAYQAPSWSWAAINCSIVPYHHLLTSPPLASGFKYLGSDVGKQFGAVQSGTLFLEARLRPAEWILREHRIVTHSRPLAVDMAEDAFELEALTFTTLSVFLMPILAWADAISVDGIGDLDPQGLILRRVGNRQYSRLGTFCFARVCEDRRAATEGPQWDNYTEQVTWFNEGEVEKFELI